MRGQLRRDGRGGGGGVTQMRMGRFDSLFFKDTLLPEVVGSGARVVGVLCPRETAESSRHSDTRRLARRRESRDYTRESRSRARGLEARAERRSAEAGASRALSCLDTRAPLRARLNLQPQAYVDSYSERSLFVCPS